MSGQLLFQNISELLFVSPEWVKQWAYILVKAKCHIYNPLILLELIGEVLKYIDLKDMWQCSKAHPIWDMEVNLELHKRQSLLNHKFKDLIKKYIETYDE
jgi:hypothetical protein